MSATIPIKPRLHLSITLKDQSPFFPKKGPIVWTASELAIWLARNPNQMPQNNPVIRIPEISNFNDTTDGLKACAPEGKLGTVVLEGTPHLTLSATELLPRLFNTLVFENPDNTEPLTQFAEASKIELHLSKSDAIEQGLDVLGESDKISPTFYKTLNLDPQTSNNALIAQKIVAKQQILVISSTAQQE